VLQIPENLEDRQWLERLICYMMDKGDLDYCYVFHNINIVATRKPFATSNGLPVPAAVTFNRESLQFNLLVYMPVVSRLPFIARVELLKHEALHLIEGHFSSYGLRLMDTYGPEIAGIAMDCYVNQKIDEDMMTAAGLPGVTVEKLGFPPGLSSEEYCDLLKDKASAKASSDTGAPTAEPGACDDPQEGTVGKGDDGTPFTGKGSPRASELFDIDDQIAGVVDDYVQDLNRALTEKFGEQHLKGRGFHGGDYDSFIKAAQTSASVPWHFYLRVAETRNRSDIVMPTRRRLSRRCPSHFGRVRRHGLDVAMMVDTSGSMGQAQLRLVDPELRGMHARGAHITVIHCDTAVARVEPYNPYESLERFYGRGGTDFSAALFELQKMQPRPGLFVGFTDGYGGIEKYTDCVIATRGYEWYRDFLSTEPECTPDGVSAVWLIPEGCMAVSEFKRDVVPWGTVIPIPSGEV
jgi:predicted metal-dependent peptidase